MGAKRRAEREKEAERTLRERGAAEMETLKTETRERYLHSGGTQEEFEKAWPSMKQEILKARTLQATEEARRQSTAHILENF